MPGCPVPNNCGNKDNVFYAKASQLSSVMQSVKDGKLFSVIPTAIAKTAVIRVHPTEASKFQIQPKELQMISQKLEETLQQLNAAKEKEKDKPKPKPAPSSTDKHGELIIGFLK